MTYLALTLPFLAIALAVSLAALLRRPARGIRRHLLATAMTMALLIALTAVFDSVMISAGLFHYSGEHLVGWFIGLAPIEDFAYPIAAALLLPALWWMLTRRATDAEAARGTDFLRQAFIASRPISWVNTAFPFAAALLLTTREVDWVLVVGVVYYLIPYNLAMYGINDVFDYASDLANPRKGGLEGALLQPRHHRGVLWLAAATNVPFLVVLAVAGGPTVWVALTVSTFAVVAYSAPGLRFKERPVLDSITSSTHFVSPAVVGLTLAGAEFQAPVLLVLGAFFAWGMAAHAFGAVQDIAPDREAGIGSIATVLGARTTVRLSLGLWLLAGVLMLLTPWPGPIAALVVVPYLLNVAPYARIDDTHAHQTNAAWRRFIWLNYIEGFLVTLILILVWSITS